MDQHPLFPLQEEVERLTRHCKVPIHIGTARLGRQSELDPGHPMAQSIEHFKKHSPATPPLSQVDFDASFLLPATGNCLIFLRGRSDVGLNRDFGEDLTVTGDSSDGPFRLHCPQFYVKTTCSGQQERSWAIAEPVNHPATVCYGDPRPIARVSAVINNFDFENGNVATDAQNSTDKTILRVQAAGRTVDFARRGDYEQVKTLLTIGALHSASLTEFSFAAWDGASDGELAAFAHNIAGLCSLVARQQARVPALSFIDGEGHPVKRLLGDVIESRFRRDYVLRFLHFEDGLPKLFVQCFDEYAKLMESDLWRRLPAFCAVVEDGVYLEQRCATLMSGLELLLRNSLIEGGLTPEEAEAKFFPELISAAKNRLGWHIPRHYTSGERTRLLRNAVSHGGPLPQAPAQVVHDLQKCLYS